MIHKRLCVDKNRSAVGGSDSATGVRSISFIPFTNHHTGCGRSPIGVFSARVGATSSICYSRYKYWKHAHEQGYNKHCNLLTVHQPIHCSCLPSSIPIPLYNTASTENLEEEARYLQLFERLLYRLTTNFLTHVSGIVFLFLYLFLSRQ